MLKNLTKWISKALSEGDGTPSSLRPPFWYHDFLIGVAFILLVGATIFFTINNITFHPMEIGGVILGWFAANRGSKLIQKAQEPTTPPPDDKYSV